MSKKYVVLLLTNRDSDNVGDQIIEACDISLLRAVFRNLGFREGTFEIRSRAAGMITQQYLKTGNEELLKSAIDAIKEADLLIFGGAPLFNYKYQSFYRRTIKTLEIANEFHVPVIFSSIGMEAYDEDNPKCQKLKAALNLPCVKQITTRDDFATLEKYIIRNDISIAKVSDPALFAGIIFRDTKAGLLHAFIYRVLVRLLRRGHIGAGKTFKSTKSDKPIIGLVVVRKGIFADNDIDFPEDEQMRFWEEAISLIEDRGYDYRLFTTGHFSDEIFLDHFSREGRASAGKCVFNINSPEELICQIRQCNGVIAYRLHASITANSFLIPSVGLEWNQKIPFYYDAVGYPHRMLSRKDWNAQTVVSVLEEAMKEGIRIDEQYMMTVYDTLFHSIKKLLKSEYDISAYSYKDLKKSLPLYSGTSNGEYMQKLVRKFKRIYDNYHKYAE